jgi:hypothetical protein
MLLYGQSRIQYELEDYLMGFKYFQGKRWSKITRDERFFCQRLYELINNETPKKFVKYLCSDYGLDVPVDGEWEVGYEVCFYRDLWQYRGRPGELFSPKRTFDLCLFGEKAIVIIEAKAAEGFDYNQNIAFMRDIDEVAKLTQVESIAPVVKLVGLCSSRYKTGDEVAETFKGLVLNWKDLAARYDGDEILLRADNVYEQREPFSKSGRRSTAKHTGADLLKAFRGGVSWWVGRSGGINGAKFQSDLKTGQWQIQQYEVNTQDDQQPSRNYFSLVDFVKAVEKADLDVE